MASLYSSNLCFILVYIIMGDIHNACFILYVHISYLGDYFFIMASLNSSALCLYCILVYIIWGFIHNLLIGILYTI